MPACPDCGRDNPEGFTFCGYCTAPLAEPAADPFEERKIVSVLFCDIVGFTASSEQADPEDVRARMQPYYSRLRREIEAFGGTVEKFIGDAVMAVFGAPVAHEDDAERAVRAGLRILEAITELNESDPSLELSVRVGINTGEVVVMLRPASEGEAAVLGDAVNTAARIQTSAPVNGVAVGEATFRATQRVFEYEPLDAVGAKGKAEPVALWRALRPRARFGSDVMRSMTTPLVGRETDLLLLRGIFDKSARERSVQLVTVVGEPGVGKSRLIAELFAYVDGLPELITWRQGRCLPYGDGVTFWALSEIVKAQAGVYESDPPHEAERKLDLVLPEEEDTPWLRARLLPLLGIDSGATASREESFTAWRRFVEHVADGGPCVLVIEDLHWADEPLLAFLEHLADWAQGVPLMVVCTSRPELHEQHPTWAAGLRNATTMGLSPLSDAETARLIGALLDQAVLPAETQQLILERAGGNPLYAEEFARMLRDRRLLEAHGTLRSDADIPFPDSIHALIAARLDTLPGERKALLQDAAVIGKVFWTGALAAMGERSRADLENSLHELARKELVRPARQSSMRGEQEFGFWHILVRDVAYAQIPRAQRARKHLLAVTWLETRARERVEDLAEVLAYHTDEALRLADATGDSALREEVLPRARRYALIAGERALGLDASKALVLLDRALDLTPREHRERPTILARWAEALADAGQGQERAVHALREAVEEFRRRGDLEAAVRALLSLAESLQRVAAPEQFATVEEAVQLARTLPKGAVLVTALAYLARIRWRRAELEAAVRAADDALAIAAELALDSTGAALGYRGLARCDLGDVGGLADIEQALAEFTTQGDGRLAAMLQSNLGYVRWMLEGPDAAAIEFEKAEALAKRRGLISLAHVPSSSRTAAFVAAGRLGEAVTRADQLLPEFEASESQWCWLETTSVRSIALTEQGFAGVDIGEEARASARRAGLIDHFVFAACPVIAGRARAGDRKATRRLLTELLETPNLKDSGEYGTWLPSLVRSALAVDAADLAERLAGDVEARVPLRQHALITAAALLAESRAEHAEAAAGFADAAARWASFGARLEHAYALLGEGRCLAELGAPEADQRLREARALFTDIGARPRVEECDLLIAGAAAMSS